MAVLRRALEQLRADTHRQRIVERDPLACVLAYPAPEDREVAGLIAALLAYGRVDLLCAHLREVLRCLGEHPASRLRAGLPRLPELAYRFHRTEDLRALLSGMRTLLLRHGSLGQAFQRHWRSSRELRAALSAFVEELRAASGEAGPGLRFLLADPLRGGACKRWLLFLRWMARSDPGDPDPGPWSRWLPASELLVPLDTHLVRVSRRLGFTARRTASWRMAEEVTAILRRLCGEDPLRYDMPLCYLGIRGYCPPKLGVGACMRCPLVRACPTGGSWAGGRRGAKRGGHGGAGPGRRLEPRTGRA